MNLKAITFALFVSTVALGCSSGHQQDEMKDTTAASKSDTKDLNEMRTGNGPGTGTGSASGTETGTPGTGTGPGINSKPEEGVGSADRIIPTGTGTEAKKPDSGIRKGKWPTQGDPFS